MKWCMEEHQEDIKCKFVRDIGPAGCWIQSHRELFCGEVTGPAFLQMDSKTQLHVIKDYLEGESDEARDVFLFIFEYPEELDTFISNCLDEQGLKVHAMFCE
ncbi:hypothetical protein G5714_022023 [Onychostoma macrolepis]|uniref:Uncharacterized protein n=1 Tax=Onychostoma macrolepis TaxID=369639 RepID=A0A7J6BUN1_9TELE|nr:hypothetical protein G5714_022023 [Onychostoma macrolepis]